MTPCFTTAALKQTSGNEIAGVRGSGHVTPNTQVDVATVESGVRYPALTRLRLAADDLTELTRQGFISTEQRGQRIRYKLRFRRNGCHQIVRYIGGRDDAEQVERELAELQSVTRLKRELNHLDRAARQLLRESKKQLAPIVERHGLRFHGREIRVPRKQSTV